MKFPKPPKKKKARKKRVNIISRLDAAVRELVLNRDKCCILCGSTDLLQWSHLITRGRYRTRWDMRNSFAMCKKCHRKHHKCGPEDFTLWFIKAFGLDVYEDLKIKAYTPMSSAERRALIVSLSEKLL